VDHFVLNEAELTLPPFLADLAKGCARRVLHHHRVPRHSPNPAPLWHLANLKHYDTVSIQSLAAAPLVALLQRDDVVGASPATKTPRRSSPSWTVSTRWAAQERLFRGRQLIGNKKQLKSECCRRWSNAQGQAGHAVQHRSVHQPGRRYRTGRAFDAGRVRHVFVGIETPNEDSWSNVARPKQGSRLVESVKRLQRAGLQGRAFHRRL